jgi:serine/threonine protein kinase
MRQIFGPLEWCCTFRARIFGLSIGTYSLSSSFVTVTGEFPFANRNNMLMLFEDIAKGNYKIPEWVTAELRDLLQRLLTVDPKKRITLAEIKDHPWMDMELPKTTPVPLESAQSLFGQDQKALQASVKKLRISSAVNSATQSRNASRNPSRNASRNPSRNASRTSSCSDSGDERDGSDTEYSSLSSDGRRSNASSSPDSRKRNGSQKSRDNGKTQRRSSGRSRHHKRCPASDDEDEPPERRPSIESGSSNSKHGKSKRVCTIM